MGPTAINGGVSYISGGGLRDWAPPTGATFCTSKGTGILEKPWVCIVMQRVSFVEPLVYELMPASERRMSG